MLATTEVKMSGSECAARARFLFDLLDFFAVLVAVGVQH